MESAGTWKYVGSGKDILIPCFQVSLLKFNAGMNARIEAHTKSALVCRIRKIIQPLSSSE